MPTLEIPNNTPIKISISTISPDGLFIKLLPVDVLSCAPKTLLAFFVGVIFVFLSGDEGFLVGVGVFGRVGVLVRVGVFRGVGETECAGGAVGVGVPVEVGAKVKVGVNVEVGAGSVTLIETVPETTSGSLIFNR